MIIALMTGVFGMWLFQFQPDVPSPVLFPLYLAAAALAPGWPRLRIPIYLVLGFGWAHAHALWQAPQSLAGINLAVPVWVDGRVASIVTAYGEGVQFVFHATEWQQNSTVVPADTRLRVTWYRDNPELLPGDRWRLRLRVRHPIGRTNPGGFDYAHWLYGQGIGYSASVRQDPRNRRLAEADGPSIHGIRQALATAMSPPGAADARSAALLRALVIGDRSGFRSRDWATFSATGTNHLVAISGLHVGLVAGLMGWLVGAAWRRLPRLACRWPAQHAGVFAGTLAAGAYAALAGFSVPTQRALLMVAVAAAMLLASRAPRPWLGLSIALLLVGGWAPSALHTPGLWLSFGAVAAMLWVLTARRHQPLLRRWIEIQLALSLGLLPWLTLFFGQASLSAPLVNLLAIPWFSLVLVPGALLGAVAWSVDPAWGETIWHVWTMLAVPTLDALDLVAGMSDGIVHLPSPSPLAFGLALLGGALLLAPRGLPARPLGIVLMLPVLWGARDVPPTGRFSVTVLDVGQGLSAVVQTAHHTLIYDAGPRFATGFDAGERIVVPALRALNVSAVDMMVISHGDNDHAGGALAVRRGMRVQRVLAGEAAQTSGAIACQAGQGWQWDGVSFTVLGPAAPGATGNNASCVLRVENTSHSLLLTGDIEAGAERAMLSGGDPRPADVVVVPHHGSRSSSSAGFVRALTPRHVVYAVGRGNRWGFPKQSVVARWRDVGAVAWRTADDGAVTFVMPPDAGEITIRSYRRQRYWTP